MLSDLALEFLAVTEAGALASAKWIGLKNGKAADQAAVDAMRKRFNEIDFDGLVVIGEGAKDEAAELYVGEKIGTGKGKLVEIAIDPLECTDSVAEGRENAMSVIAAGPEGSLLRAADSYMEKLAVGPKAKEFVDLDAPIKTNLISIARALNKQVCELTVAILDRKRHEKIEDEILEAGARIRKFKDGDVVMAIATCLSTSPIDVLMGIGGSTEAVLAAVALKCLGGEMLCRWKLPEGMPEEERTSHLQRLREAGIDINKGEVYSVDDLVRSDDVTFTATGVMNGPFLDGVSKERTTHSMIITGKPHCIRYITTNPLVG